MNLRIRRTLLNWRWWVLVPIAPLSLAFHCLQWATTWMGHGFALIYRWYFRNLPQ